MSTKEPRIIFLCQRVPYPPDRGDRITTYNVIRMLKTIGKVRIGCFVEHEREKDSVRALESMGYEVFARRLRPGLKKMIILRHIFSNIPLTLPYFFSWPLKERVDSWVAEGCDIGMCYSSSMGQYLLGKQGFKRIMQFAELDSDKWLQLSRESGFPMSWVYAREARLLLEFEDRVAREFDLSLVVSPVEKQIFMERIPGVEPMVVENGVDFDYFRPDESVEKEEMVVFTGVMNYPPNVLGVKRFVSEVWPVVKERRPGARFFIVGSDPVGSIRALHGRMGIHVTGRVPDTRPYMNRASVAVAPLWVARGIQNKILEAMSMALPVVATSAAFSGINAEPGKSIFVEDEPGEFAGKVCLLLENPETAREKGKAARSTVIENYEWSKILEKLKKYIQA